MCILCILVLFCFIAVSPVTADTTEVTVTKLAVDNLTIINERTVSYQWMRDNLPVLGDGTTHYYLQGPVFVDDPTNETHEQELRWNSDEDTNCYPEKDFGALRGTDLVDLCDLVGGMSPGKEVKVQSSDGWNRKFAYANVYLPTTRTGPMAVAWEKDGQYPETGYTDGMRLVWFADTSVNPWGEHIFGNFDWYESAAPQYWYYYTSGSESYPTTTGLSGQNVSDLIIYSNDPVPPPVADFSANIKTGHIVNGNFETCVLNPWTGIGATINTGSNKKGTAGLQFYRIAVGSNAWIQEDIDLTNVDTIRFWRRQICLPGKELQVLIDGNIVALFNESSGTIDRYETIDFSSLGFSGIHNLKFNVYNGGSSLFTVYLDDIEDFGPGTSGPAPLTVQFKDLSTKMEDTSHTSWAWDFQNDGSTDSTSQNPSFIYTANGTYTVKMTATNAGGSDSEIKTGYITVSEAVLPPVANFTATPTAGTTPLAVTFTDTSTNSPTSWKWAYKNATVGWTQFSTVQNPSYTFAAGTYDINLTATNAAGSDDEIKNGYITVSEAVSTPVANFTASPRSGTAPLAVTFTDTSTNTPTSWKWAYKNATVGWTQFSTVQNPSYTFAAGTYDINLTATNAAGSDDEIKTGYITVAATPYIDVDISGSIDNWNFLIGTNEDTTSVDMTVDTNMDSWLVEVKDALTGGKPAGTEGKMAEWSVSTYMPSGKMLTNAVQVKSGSGSYITLSGTNQHVQAGTASGTYDIGMKQVVAGTDPALEGDHKYRIVITFTGAAA